MDNLQEYRIALSSCDTYEIYVEASSLEEAQDLTRKMWEASGPKGFKHRTCSFDIEPVFFYPSQGALS